MYYFIMHFFKSTIEVRILYMKNELILIRD